MWGDDADPHDHRLADFQVLTISRQRLSGQRFANMVSSFLLSQAAFIRMGSLGTRATFLKEFLGRNVRDPEVQAGPISKAPDGLLAMSPFLDGDYYFLLEQIGWRPTGEHEGRFPAVKVPKGFVTDLASIPRLLWPLLPRDGRYAQPAVIHDYMYWVQDSGGWAKAAADRIFWIGMRELNVSKFQCAIIFWTVSAFGGPAWKNNARLRANNEGRILRSLPQKPVTFADWKSKRGVFMDRLDED